MVPPWAKFNELQATVTECNNAVFTGHCLERACGATAAADAAVALRRAKIRVELENVD